MLNFDEHCAAWGLRFESWKMMMMMMNDDDDDDDVSSF